ncbi:unnamed protein product [Amoebophrya sp. A25]|nr:unnamed protein product [Amoebophrya sp. A25]|eukprot:GSA25T00008424001.1
MSKIRDIAKKHLILSFYCYPPSRMIISIMVFHFSTSTVDTLLDCMASSQLNSIYQMKNSLQISPFQETITLFLVRNSQLCMQEVFRLLIVIN